MKKKLTALMLAGVVCAALGLTGCGQQKAPATTDSQPKASDSAKPSDDAKTSESNSAQPSAAAEKPGESGFAEEPIGEEVIGGPYKVAAVYFQGVDMIPEGRQPSAAESDMHLEADIHLTSEAAKTFGFGDGEEIWPAYLTVNYVVSKEDGTEVTSGAFMPMNADDGAHYGANIKKGVIPVGKYKLRFEIQPSSDYLLHVDEETGVPAVRGGGSKDAAAEYYKKQIAEFDWDYAAVQLTDK